MSARAIGEIIGGLEPAKQRRTFQPCRRNSYHRGEREARLWQPIASTKADAHRLIAARMKAAEFYDRHQKEKGKRNGSLGHVALEVLRELYRIVDFKTGRLEPAIDTICGRVRRARASVVAALARLKAHGFLDWIRRTEPTDNDGAGPQVRQISNAYWFGLPAYAAAWVRKTIGKGPPPDCELARRAADQAETEAMLNQASTDEEVDFLVGRDSPDAAIFKRMNSTIAKNSASSLGGQNPAPRIL